MKHLQGSQVLVLGLGESGLAMARWCARCGANMRVWDSREAPPHLPTLREALPEVAFIGGPMPAIDEMLADVQLVLKSPGLAPHDERIAPLLRAAAARGIAVAGELDLFSRALADLKQERGYAPQVLAITGTNGKTTTTALTALLVERCGRSVAAAGNIGPTMLDTLASALDMEPAWSGEITSDDAEDGSAADGVVAGGDTAAPNGEAAPSAVEGDDAEATEATSEDAPASDGTVDGAADAAGAAGPSDDFQPTSIELPPPQAKAPVFEHLPEVWVLELSSFQLADSRGFEPSAAVVLNVTQDHLDWHGDMAAYAQAKARIFGRDAVMVINRDDPGVAAMVPLPPAPDPKAKKAPKPPAPREVLRFGFGPPQAAGDFGVIDEGGIAWLVRAQALDDDHGSRRPRKGAAAVPLELHLQRLMPADALRLRGRHNASNALAALALATAIGCSLAPMLHGLREYRGEAHRVEPVALIDGVEAVDDSKGTNVGATVAALESLGADKHPGKLVVILGGDGKGQDFAPLAAPVARHARAVALIGRDAQAIEAALAEAGVPRQRHETLEAATRWCFEQARSGDAVLLSPACASMDMFRNYAHRAEVFLSAVRALAADRGEVVT